MKSAVAAELSWPQVHAFRLQRHHLEQRAPEKDLARVVGDIGGAQAQVMSSAELQIAVRVSCTVADVRKALWEDRTLVKTWLMRGTLHLASSDDLPLYTAAMSTRWVSQMRPSWLKYMQTTADEFWELVDQVGGTLDGRPMTRDELIEVVGKGKSERIRELLRSGWGGMLKPAARNGRLCFGPNRGQSVTFVSPREWLKSWRAVDPEVALGDAARRYLRAYGPATKNDFARWWGAWPGVAAAAWSALAKDIVSVYVEGSRGDILASDLADLRQAGLEEHVSLLPGFDPYLLGHAKRDHLFDRAQAPKVSRTAGWISAVVLVDGRVEGTWKHAIVNRTLRIRIEPFRRLSPAIRSQVRQRAAEIGTALGTGDVDVKVA